MNRTPQKTPERSHVHKHMLQLLEAGLSEMPLVWTPYDENTIYADAVDNWKRVQQHAKHPEPWDITQEFEERIVVNYLRHIGMNYDRVRRYFLSLPYGSRMQYLIHAELKSRALAMIRQRYPKYKAQCEHQRETHRKWKRVK